VTTFSDRGDFERFSEFALPTETRAEFAARGWESIVAFQTRNPMHRSHEYLTKVALEICDGLLIHPTIGRLKEGDLPGDVRLKCYRMLIEKYYPKSRTLLAVYPLEMRYAGPREAILHAIIRQNFGCTHIIIGRDHAGVGRYYEPFAAHGVFDGLAEGDLRIKPLKMDWTFWCRTCDAVTSYKTCPHSDDDRLLISGTALREMLASGERPPVHYSRPEIVDILVEYYRKGDATQ
jgi:sulfate adenylyltransferase